MSHTHADDTRIIADLIAQIELLEAATFRSRVKAIISKARQIVIDAVDVLNNSRFSPSARLRFRSRVSGIMRRNGHVVADLGWQAGGGKEGDFPRERLNNWMANQQQLLSQWFLAIRDTGTIPGGKARAQLYAKSLEGLYNEYWGLAQQATAGAPPMPAYPRDGTTDCFNNCQCRWEGPKRVEVDGETVWRAWWRISPVENCDTCLCRAEHWNPLTFRAVGDQWREEPSNGPVLCELFRT